ncbi:MAG: NUDIX domain-containing protein [Pseudomonadota bacterium]
MNSTATPRPSSTIALARAGSLDPEIFMVKRHARSSFGSAYAFPGGVVDPEDAEVAAHCDGLDDREASSRLGIEAGGLEYFSAAIRELFEETGVLLADYERLDENLGAVRDSLNAGDGNWADFVKRGDCRLQCDRLHYFSHWVTPQRMEKRYSTRFFLAALPPGQEAAHCGGELTESCWVTAKEMLAAGRRGDAKLHFPTIKTLETIARHKSLDALLDWAASKYEWGITSMIPRMIERNGKREVVLPGDKDYPGDPQ